MNPAGCSPNCIKKLAVKEEMLEMEIEKFVPEEMENIMGDVARFKSEIDLLDHEIYDKYKIDVKIEAVDVKEESREIVYLEEYKEIAETEEQKVHFKFGDYRVDVGSLPVRNLVKEEKEKGVCVICKKLYRSALSTCLVQTIICRVIYLSSM